MHHTIERAARRDIRRSVTTRRSAARKSVGVTVDDQRLYHIGFARSDLPDNTEVALLSGDPGRSELIALQHLGQGRVLARNRGLDSFVARLPGGRPVVCATSGMGAPSMSIVVNELVQVGIRCIIRIGTCGAIQPRVRVGDVVISSSSLCRQGAAEDIAPTEFPAAADPFLTVVLADVAATSGIAHHVGVTASVDTFFEGQERSASSANPKLLRRVVGMIDEYAGLGVLNLEMETGTLFKMGLVYGFAAGAVCGVVAQRAEDERPRLDLKDQAVDNAVRVAIGAAGAWERRT
jgi:uridine phosphorylase